MQSRRDYQNRYDTYGISSGGQYGRAPPNRSDYEHPGHDGFFRPNASNSRNLYGRSDARTGYHPPNQRQSNWCEGYGNNGGSGNGRAPFDYGPLGPVGGPQSRQEVRGEGSWASHAGWYSRPGARMEVGDEARGYGRRQQERSPRRESRGEQYSDRQKGKFRSFFDRFKQSSSGGQQYGRDYAGQRSSERDYAGQSPERGQRYGGGEGQQRRHRGYGRAAWSALRKF
ncbi:uncharacterized protein RCC_07376 [Ramularia collo-cygni]|uniref:Uncharacterized protein n=1 Tax=Ramularia collo-cygni TaxID=112498 RepID=A0A2D3VKG0_9PEZI|nr:uncharacterized protein RCC_07376 [Ramularia collo-cygni]CZT21513.1 uncharacterized protein RCC_07376 [Ramularia collo-cygni]